jgi:hypothetical protein
MRADFLIEPGKFLVDRLGQDAVRLTWMIAVLAAQW